MYIFLPTTFYKEPPIVEDMDSDYRIFFLNFTFYEF